MSEKNSRIAIVSADRCKPKKCRQECKRSCPVVKTGKLCIEVTPTSKIAFISEILCIGCGICVKKCPFDAIQIINLPTNLESHTTHRYSANSFKLHRLPTPRPGQVLGLVGTNGIGKSTALKILAGKQKPNLGRFDDPPEWQEIIKYFRGSELQNYFTKMLEDDIKAIIKPQYVDNLPRAIKGPVQKVGELLKLRMEKDEATVKRYIKIMQLEPVLNREVANLSGGELQRFAIAMSCVQDADVYMFDEPSSYLDVKQRLNAAQIIRSLLEPTKYVIAVEHDLSVLDYLSDFVCIIYGVPSVYGVVTLPSSVREGINIFLDGHIPAENLRFRTEALQFRISDAGEELKDDATRGYEYPPMKRTQGDFILETEAGDFSDSEILVMMGENGTGKTTLIRLLAGAIKADEGSEDLPKLNVSMKPQKIAPKFPGTVRQLFFKKIRAQFLNPQFQTDVVKPLKIDDIIDQEVQHLSGGELQRVAIVLALGIPADIYLIDEPSAYLDSEQRIICSKVIRRFILHNKKTAFIVEHDFIMATYLADKVIVFDGTPSKHAFARAPESLLTGCNRFLKNLNVTFRRDPNSFRPRINKLDSQMDKEQKSSGNYFFLDNTGV
ncbi:similar to Saccharomyces cerevisiae YDR091C RLI1 Essential iron-sulfur protein required for ribosome biogenesis and translation initiation and termination [Maudiozyma barnettii]|uniref:Translation initiation factor RLI1 n=1 Tax=Maudiozyma barnettii TaxID=61262 RepID=A0A8H2VHW8_9SACH|nr:Fe-S cluster-binding ribosome biosynthesis protein [Kazachstania barnettii]CAB4255726.1 similar to Saccharomyces cerevisiae YDR091C RLI1 Essential iron-sulfur protein required for ribosome biogenesis and translation initiation and termination [Kazachstania barnettii]CAD1784287.1 similar to Saccharomyces cerevisiae YDR091C RLI1 Essential iron-sulfur protein required for ribosome biogenesis and translation initiation and termination [Kazachstania barnettii]